MSMRQVTPAPGKASGTPKKADVTRVQILLAAAQLFSQKGYAETTLRQVAEKVSLKPASVYYHFESKEQILEEVLNAGIVYIKTSVETALAGVPADAAFRDRFNAAVRAHLRVMLDHRDEAGTYIRVYSNLPPIAKFRSRKARQEYTNIWRALLEDAQARGDIAQDVDLGLFLPFILGAMNRAAEWYTPKRGTIPQLADLITRLVCDGAAPRRAAL
ncbi:TetR/AcrR family transcriptional regulator [Futiania mangrovi]|uniref:TetR/AcrR family transcriptional regulator n=1 Tax=Futiania mangrovi TaxID=2959716 RepID=A0A9J6PHE7_9PROT|nr:TetR/AcrR family transcriptional regulator [Futiania mangrovii]MCP1335514.1 TetR/AcrR family transcriptional regulator [Futiania mangrovii]